MKRIDIDGPYISRNTTRRATLAWLAVCLLAALGCAVQILNTLGVL